MKMTMANCPSSVRNMEGLDTGVQGRPVASDTGTQGVQYSINNLVEQVHRLQRLCWHMVLLWEVIIVLIRWEVPFVTLSFWIVSLLICFFMESGQLLVSCFSFLFLVGGVGGVAKLNCQNFQKSMATPKLSNQSNEPSSTTSSSGTPASSATTPQEKDQSTTAQDAEQHQRRGREVLVEYRQLMLQAQDYLKACCEVVQRVNAVLGWQDTKSSSVFYGGAFLTLLLLYALPLRWCVMAAITSVLCLNQHFLKVVKELRDSSHYDHPSVTNNKLNEKKLKEFNDMVPEKELKDQVSTDVKPPIHPLIEHRPLHLCQKSKSLDEAGPNYAKLALAAATRNRSSTAPELPTLRLNSAGIPVEVCFLCGTMFSAVLKRRRYCRSCGNQFCQRCCSRKLPRSTFGATSPAAQTEKELVCNACYCSMTSDEVTSSTSGPTIEEC